MFGLKGKTLRSEEHTSELQSRPHLVCRLLLEKKKKLIKTYIIFILTYNHTLLTTFLSFFFFNDTSTTEIYTLSLHDALPIYLFVIKLFIQKLKNQKILKLLLTS